MKSPRMVDMPVCNGRRLLAGALDPILAQRIWNLQVLIPSETSADRSRDICIDYAGLDRHTSYLRQENVSHSEVLRWSASGARARVSATQRLYLEYMRSVFSLDSLGLPSRLTCAGAVTTGVGAQCLRVLVARWRRKHFERGPA